MLQRGDQPQSSGQSVPTEPLTALLRLAAQTGSVAGIRARLDKGDAVNGRDAAGRTALMIAATHGHGDVCSTLLELGAHATTRTSAGDNAADFARRAGHDQLADRLCAGMADRGTTTSAELTAQVEAEDRPIDEVSLFQSYEWESEEESLAPKDDISIRRQAAEVQAALGRHVAIDDAEDWSDIDAALPAVAREGGHRHETTIDSLRLIAFSSLTNGVVCCDELTESLLDNRDLPSERETDLLRLLQRSLADAGVHFEEDANELVPALIPNEECDLHSPLMEQADEIAHWVMALASGRDDPMWHWARQMQAAGDLLSHEEEMRLGAEIRDALTSGIRALLQCKQGRSALLATVSHALPSDGPSDHDDGEEPTSVSDAQEDDGQAPGLPRLDEVLFRLAEGSYHCNDKDVRALEHWMRRHSSGLASLDHALGHLLNGGQQWVLSSGLHDQVARLRVARDEFVNKNLRLVFSIARKFSYSGMSFSDLVQEGSIGLMKAVARYDPDRGFRFSTYATWWIRQSITRARQCQARVIRLPVHVEEQVRAITLASETLEAKLGRSPSRDELESESGIRAVKLGRLLNLCDQTVWSDDEANSDWPTWVDRSWPSDANAEDIIHSVQLRDHVRSRLATLSKKEAMVVAMRYGIGTEQEHTLEEVGKAFGVTRERIRQIENKVLKRLRAKLAQEAQEHERHEFPPKDAVEDRAEHDSVGDSTDRSFSPEVKLTPVIAEASEPPVLVEIRDVLDILSSAERQLQFAQSCDSCSPQREFAKRWFTAYNSAEAKNVFSVTQHEDFRSLTIAVRGSLRRLGFGVRHVSELLADPSWQAVVSEATRARSSLDAPSASEPPMHEASNEHA